ncbi:MAG TPA: isoprenylcysteine carboxylmethyltransferase family protein [Deltaproteobacteria bacterium]|nr:isoprenylcysteine carboxylmethyltransferase family protein [Deltaproteobacteria bacterium]
MTIGRRRLRKALIVAGCLFGTVEVPAAPLGICLIGLGGVLHLWSKGCLEQNLRLITSGPYRFSRNPFYLANGLVDLGLCLVIGRLWITLVYFGLWALAYRATIAKEERRLESLFPGEFSAYRACVPVLIPTGRRWPRADATGRFSFGNPALARGSEYARLLGIAMAPAVIQAAGILRRERGAIFLEENAAGLAVIVFLAALWIVKLALAETFRRPETMLLPFERHPLLRMAIGLALLGAAVAVGEPWAMALPVLWMALLVLDRGGRFLFDGRREEGRYRLVRRPWRFFPAIAFGSILVFSCVTVLNHWPPV